MRELQPRAGLGASSILLILVVLCLTAFSVLALVSARVDARQTEAAAETAARYYAADAAAQKTLNSIDAALLSGADPTALDGVTRDANNADALRFSVPLGDGRELTVELAVLTRGSGARYRVTRYALVNTTAWSGTRTSGAQDAS